jgi:hypothetical protein
MVVEVEKVGVGSGEAACISQRFFHGLLGERIRD